MDVFKVAGIAVITAVTASAVRSADLKLGLHTAAAGGLILLAYAVSSLSGLVGALENAMNGIGIGSGLLEFIFKVTGIAYTAQLAANICTDMGEQGLAEKTVLCGRLAVVAAALPRITALLTALKELVNECLG